MKNEGYNTHTESLIQITSFKQVEKNVTRNVKYSNLIAFTVNPAGAQSYYSTANLKIAVSNISLFNQGAYQISFGRKRGAALYSTHLYMKLNKFVT